VRVLRAADRAAEANEVAERVAALSAPERRPVESPSFTARCASWPATKTRWSRRDIRDARRRRSGAAFRAATCSDALALLWIAVDRFHHVWTLRALQTPMLRLSDASIAILCGEPADPQPALFALPTASRETDRAGIASAICGSETTSCAASAMPIYQRRRAERLAAFRSAAQSVGGALRTSDVETPARSVRRGRRLLLARPGETLGARAACAPR